MGNKTKELAKNKEDAKNNGVSSEKLEKINCCKREVFAWPQEKRLAMKVILEARVEDGKSYNSLFAMGAFLINPVITIFLKLMPESGYFLMGAVIVLTVCFTMLWVSGRERLCKNVALLKLLEEIDESECKNVECGGEEEQDVLS